MNIIRNVEIVKRRIPVENTFFLPMISASRPNGRRNIADERIKLLITHPSSIALAFRSFPIDGRARFTAEPRKGVRNAAKVATSKTDLFDVFSSVFSEFIVTVFTIRYPVSLSLSFSSSRHSPSPFSPSPFLPLTSSPPLSSPPHSFSFVSIIIVTGPSLISSICIIAPNSPVPISFPSNPENLVTNAVIQRNRNFRRSSTDIGRPVSFFCFCMKCKLAYSKNFSSGINN